MSRLMSVSMTEQAVIERRKTVTRRKGWWTDKHGRRLIVPGDRLTLCRKVMGRKPGEPLVRLAEVEVVDVSREPLGDLVTNPFGINPLHPMTDYARDEMVREGFPGMHVLEFIDTYFVDAQGIQLWDEITRIEWRYLDGAS